MGKKQRIEELERRVEELEVRIVQLEARPTVTWYPQGTGMPQQPTHWWQIPSDYSTESTTNSIKATDQRWFWTPEWQAEELVVESELATGQFEDFDNMDDFLTTLND